MTRKPAILAQADSDQEIRQVTLQQRGELPVLVIANAHATATIALQGAQVLEFTPRSEPPVIWLSGEAAYRRGQSVRGGIPLCWPWFGALERNPAAVQAMVAKEGVVESSDHPAHGLVRDRDWTLQSIDEREDCTEVTMGFVTDHLLQARWPHAAALTLTVRVGRTLQVTLAMRNLGHDTLTVTQALHSYLAVSDVDRVAVTGLEGTRYLDTLDRWVERQQQGEIRFTGETDRVYLDVPSTVRLRDEGWERSIDLRATHSASAVVWNPWAAKAARLSQFAPEAWRGMVCIETANVMGDCVTLAPGTSATLGVEIGTAPLDRSE